jgi:hypothetical protein
MKSFLRALCAAAAILAWGTVGFAGPIEVVYSFPSPLPFPRFDLDFDTSTGTLWGIENSTKKPNIMNFDRSGTLIQGFIGEDDFNSTGIAVDPLVGRIFYWQNLLRNLHEARYPDGAFIGTTQFPFGYQATANYIDYDPVLNRVVIAIDRFVSIPPFPEIRPGFDFITPGSIDFSVDLDFLAIGNLAGIRGFELTHDSYWILGPHSLYDKIVQIDRTTGHLVDEFILPDSNGKPAIYTGLTLDPSTGLFYSNYSDEGIRALKTAPVTEPSSLALFALSLGTLGFWRPCLFNGR